MPSVEHLSRLRWRIAALLAAACVASCAAPVRVESLATGQPERMAYQLFGGQLSDLRRRADELCPDGVEVWRAAEAHQSRVPAAGASLVSRWVQVAADAVTPSVAQAQLVVSCTGASVPEAGGLGWLVPPAKTQAAPAAELLTAPARPAPKPVAARIPPGKAPVTDYD